MLVQVILPSAVAMATIQSGSFTENRISHSPSDVTESASVANRIARAAMAFSTG